MPDDEMPPSVEHAADGEPDAADPFDGRFEAAGETLRERTARGTLVVAAFQVGFTGLEFARRMIVVAFLSAAEFGFFGLLIVSLSVVLWLKQIGVSDKYIQQSETDQEVAFQKAFTIELVWTLVIWVLMLAVLPFYALVFDQPGIVMPGAVLSLAVIGSALQAPTWIWYRRMDFVRQRTLLAIEPTVSFVVTVPLAVTGAGYWSLIVGALAGTFAHAIASLALSPYRVRLRLDRDALRDYWAFSWPIALVSGSALLIVQASTIVGEAVLGLAGVGVIGVAGLILRSTLQVDRILTSTIYPAICAVQDRLALLHETFTKSNRLALLWAVPTGIGLSLFASDLVHQILGEQWVGAIDVLSAFGIIVAFQQIAYNWSAFMRARGDTRPLATNAVLTMVAFMAVGVPLMIVMGLSGYVLGMAIVTVVDVGIRIFFLRRRLFPGFDIVRHTVRSFGPTLPAAALVLGIRALWPGRTPELAAIELALYLGTALGATLLLERELVREILGYLRRAPGAEAGLAGV